MDRPLQILVVDDEPTQREILADILTDEGHEVITAGSGTEALTVLESNEFDLVITDLRMPGASGLEVLRTARQRVPDVVVILMTAYGTVSSAVEAMKTGAYDYLQKPFDKDELVQRVRRVAERASLVRENRRLREELGAKAAPRIEGRSDAIRRLVATVDKLARIPGDVLVTGESGTGKELVARALHYNGPRAPGPFVPVNCAAIPEGLAESELFGHEKGAFTHASASRAGRFEQADGGTLFLDEISSMPVALQAKLLRVIQDRVIERVGGNRSRRLDLRIVAATNRNLPALVESAGFREDLYHRLNVHEVFVPPLRERVDDIPFYAELFRDRAAVRFDMPSPPLEDELVEFLQRYPFPGNVRELEHMMEKMVVLSEGEPLGVEDLPPSVTRSARPSAAQPSSVQQSGMATSGTVPVDAEEGVAGPARPERLLEDGPISLGEVEERLLREAIRKAGGNLSEAARQLGISYKTMRYRARKFGLVIDDPGR